MFDVIVIGLGCAGYTAAIYTARYKLSTLIVGLEEGGMGATAAEVGNWPGIQEIRGPDLMENFKNHALSFKDLVTHRMARVTDIVRSPEGHFTVTFEGGDTAEAKTVIFATGSNKRKLGAPGEADFAGKGVSYCATCDAFFYRGKTVAVVGGGDSAVEGAAIAAQVAKTVYLIHRRKEFRAEPFWVDEMKKKANIVPVLERSVVEILGDQKVRALKLSAPFKGEAMLSVDGVFIEIGATPAVELPRKIGCALDEIGYLQVDEAQRTSIPGAFGAGDVTSASNHFAQFATAAGEGSVAANSVFNYLQGDRL